MVVRRTVRPLHSREEELRHYWRRIEVSAYRSGGTSGTYWVDADIAKPPPIKILWFTGLIAIVLDIWPGTAQITRESDFRTRYRCARSSVEYDETRFRRTISRGE